MLIRFFKTEEDERLTVAQLIDEYYELKKNHETEQETFRDYARECCSKNGSLEEISSNVSREEMIQTLSDAINFSNSNEGGDLGDRLFEVLITIRKEWGLE